MYSSPATPTGTGSQLARRGRRGSCSRSGRPIGSGLALASTRATVDQIVVSVGPYMFHSSSAAREQRVGELARQRLAAARAPCSPGRPATRASSEHPPRRRRRLHDRRAAARRAARRARAGPSAVARGRDRRRARRRSSGRNSSSPAMSNESVVTATSTSSAREARLARASSAGSSTSARCGISTPFGRPVEPDV